MFKFLPTKEIRNFSAKDFIGKFFEIDLREISEDKKLQWVIVRGDVGGCGWVPFQGKKDAKIKRQVQDAYIMEHQNGGRSDHDHYDSYKAYFNDEKKEIVKEFWKRGLMGRLSRSGGDPDEISLILVFKDFKIENNLYEYHAPEEWYSEMHQDNPKFKFKRGFYETAEEAIKFFADKPNDDLFGERYFPVVVFPKKIKCNVRDIVCFAKGYSKPIIVDDRIIYGTRCKPSEYQSVIQQTYDSGGKVAKAMQWDWDE